MATSVTFSVTNLSPAQLSTIMDSFGLSQDATQLKRTCVEADDVIKNMHDTRWYQDMYASGSQAECCDIRFLDRTPVLNKMLILDGIRVRHTAGQTADSLWHEFLVKENSNNPAYVYLLHLKSPRMKTCCLLDTTLGSINKLLMPTDTGELMFSSKLFNLSLLSMFFKKEALYENEERTTNAPAIRVKGRGGDRHVVYALHCSSWPKQADEWLHRERKHWPSPELVRNIKNHGCDVVPVGPPNCEDSHVMWRLSFSPAERKLVWAMNNVQLKCYGLLKLIKMSLFQTYARDVINSYHIKTVLFWTIEETDSELWVEHNLLRCVDACLSNLEKMLLVKQCKDYFIIGQNLFSEFDGGLLFTLGEVVSSLSGSWFKSMPELMKMIEPKLLLQRRILSEKFLRANIREIMLEFSMCRWTFLRDIEEMQPKEALFNLYSTYTHLSGKSEAFGGLKADIIDNMSKVIAGYIGSHNVIEALANKTSNRLKYRKYRTSLAFLRKGMTADATSGRLKLAWVFYILGLYSRSLRLLDYVFKKFYCCDKGIQAVGATSYKIERLNVKLNGMYVVEKLRKETALPIMFVPSELNIVTKPLHIEMTQDSSFYRFKPNGLKTAAFDSVAFAHYLKIVILNDTLCNTSQVGQEVKKFKRLFADPPCELHETASDLNLLGHCYRLCGDFREAQRTYQESADIGGLDNSAKLHIADMQLEMLNN